MPVYVDFYTGLWSERWFRESPPEIKIIFPYLWTNDNKNISAMYEIDTGLIAYQLGIPEPKILTALQYLVEQNKIMFDPDISLVWVINHVKHQYLKTENISEKQAKGVFKAVRRYAEHPFYQEFMKKYPDIERVSNGYLMGMDTHSNGYGMAPGKGKGTGKVKGKDIILKKESKKSLKDKSSLSQQAEIVSQIILHLNAKSGSHYRASTEDTRKKIIARLAEGFILQDFLIVINRKVAQWGDDRKMAPFLRPETLFCKKHFASYVGEPDAARKQSVAEKILGGSPVVVDVTPDKIERFNGNPGHGVGIAIPTPPKTFPAPVELSEDVK